MNVTLSPELEQLVHSQLETGRYGSITDVISDALRLMRERDQVWDLHQAAIRDKTAAGVTSLRAGHSADGEAFTGKMDTELTELAAEGR